MNITRRNANIGAISLLASASMSTLIRAEDSFLGIGEGLEDSLLASEAYIYGYPLVTMEMTRRVITNVATVEAMRMPMGQFGNAREYPTSEFRDVTAPNADTLYSVAWLDLAKEPYIFSLPDEDG